MSNLSQLDRTPQTPVAAVQDDLFPVTNDALADLLQALDVSFLWGGLCSASSMSVPVDGLIAALANSTEARLRLALIPLFLRHPSFAQHAEKAAAQLSNAAVLVLHCYYTAAYYLQQKYQSRLDSLLAPITPLPDLFSVELTLPTATTPEDGLQALAARHRILSGQPINWLGTYEHGAQRFITYLEKQQTWQKLQSIKSDHY